MILVEAPEEHDIGESTIGAATFDEMDLDSILQNQASKPEPKSQKSEPATPQAPQPVAPRNSELKPGEDWTNPATKKKQRVVLVSMACVGAALLIGALAMYLLSRPKPDNDKVAIVDRTSETAETEKNDSPESDSPEMSADRTDESSDEQTDGDVEVSDSDDPEMDGPESLNPGEFEAPTIDGIPDTPPEIGSADSSDVPESEGFGDTTKTDDSGESKSSEAVPDKEEGLGKVEEILAQSGTSILKIQNAASNVRNDFAIGTPRYFFEKVVFESGDPTKKKEQVLLGVSYRQQTLQSVLHELAAISGLQLTLDAPAIALAKRELNPRVEVQVENESTREVIRKVAESVGLFAYETDQGFRITIEQELEFVQDKVNVALLIENKDEGLALATLVRQMVWPGSWEADPNKADQKAPKGTCVFGDGELVLNHAPFVIDEVKNLIAGLNAFEAGKAGDSELLKPIPWIDTNSFAKPFAPRNSVRLPIGKFFESVSEDYDVRIFGDWHSLGELGWSSHSMAPGRIVEPTVGDVVRETAHGMGAFLYMVDPQTAWVTTPSVANNIFLIRAYPLAEVANGRVTSESIQRILIDSLGAQTAQPGISFFFLPRQKVMLLRAPQMFHRQVSAVVDQLE